MSAKLRIGRIHYLNLLPIFRTLKRECDCSNYEFVEGYPSALNKMLREGRIDVSPSSSVEYLRRPGDYSVIRGHSLSSFGRVDSILLFSRVAMNDLGGREVFVTHQSETSVALLEIILRKFHGLDFDIKVSNRPSREALEYHSAFLAIGDDALSLANEAKDVAEDCPETGCSFIRFGLSQYFVYDLGEIWYEQTGLPFVFALWIARRDLPDDKRTFLEGFIRDLDYAKSQALKKLPELAAGIDFIMSPKMIVEYWRRISYDLEDDHRKGLELFRSYLDELGLLNPS